MRNQKSTGPFGRPIGVAQGPASAPDCAGLGLAKGVFEKGPPQAHFTMPTVFKAFTGIKKMFSQDDDGQQGLVLTVVFGLMGLVIALVIGLAIHQARQVGVVSAASPAAAPVAVMPALMAPADAANAAQAASDAASIKVENGVVKFYFASGKAELAAGAGDALADVVKGARDGRKLVISGFHDATGDAAKNAALAKQRALAVHDALRMAGVPVQQIELRKPEQMAGSGSNDEARRVEVSLQ